MSRLIRTLVLRISFNSAELPYLAFSRNDSATYSALFSQLPLRNMPSAMASFSTEMCPSFMQAAVSRVGMRSSISCSFSLMSQLVSRPYLISRLYSSICMLGVRASSFLPTKSNSSSASLRSFSSTAFSSSMKQDLTLSCGSRRAMKASTSVRIRAQSADLSMPTMERMELSVYFSWELRSEMREMVDRKWSIRPFWLQMLSSWLRIFTLQFFSPCVSAVSYNFYSSSTALSNFPSRISDSISKYSSSTCVSTFCSSSSACGSSSQTYSSSYSQSDMYPARVVIIYIQIGCQFECHAWRARSSRTTTRRQLGERRQGRL